METDLPEPVAPAIKRWGIFERSAKTGMPATSRPKASVKVPYKEIAILNAEGGAYASPEKVMNSLIKKAKKIGAILSWLVVGVILTVALTLAVSNFNTPIGLRVFAILSGSMDPNLSTGSLVITKNQSSYTVGDIVTIRSERSAKENVTHRISEIEIDDSGNIRYQLKGDVNEKVAGKSRDCNGL